MATLTIITMVIIIKLHLHIRLRIVAMINGMIEIDIILVMVNTRAKQELNTPPLRYHQITQIDIMSQ